VLGSCVAPSPGREGVGVRIKVHPGLCVGRGACRQFASAVYQLDGEGYLDLHLLQVPPELERDAEVGASACTARAISVLADAPGSTQPTIRGR
jgi:ferredoxin